MSKSEEDFFLFLVTSKFSHILNVFMDLCHHNFLLTPSILFYFICLSLFLFVYLSPTLSFCLSLSIFFCLSISLSLCLSFCLFPSLYVYYLSVNVYLLVSFCLSIRLFLSFCLSICLYLPLSLSVYVFVSFSFCLVVTFFPSVYHWSLSVNLSIHTSFFSLHWSICLFLSECFLFLSSPLFLFYPYLYLYTFCVHFHFSCLFLIFTIGSDISIKSLKRKT